MNKLIMVCVLVLAFIAIGISAGGGIGGTSVTTKDIEYTYPTTKAGLELTKSEMNIFDGITYEVQGNTIILNKQDVFFNREIRFVEQQSCLSWNEPSCTEYSVPECLEWEVRPEPVCLKYEGTQLTEEELLQGLVPENICIEWETPRGCIEFDSKIGDCVNWEAELQCLQETTPFCVKYSEKTCKTWTTYTRDDFIKQAIQKEIEFVRGVQIERANRTLTQTDTNGKIIIK